MYYAFLENSDDARNTPTLPLYNLLKNELASITIHDPYITEDEGLTMIQDLEEKGLVYKQGSGPRVRYSV